jgi:hypothetical protein
MTTAKKAPAKKAAAPEKKVSKGEQIVAYYAKHKGATPAEVAKALGCSVGRVYEQIRAGLVPEGSVSRPPHKGDALLRYFETHGPCSRADAAKACGATVGRAAEVVRANAHIVLVDEKTHLYGVKPVKATRTTKKAS